MINDLSASEKRVLLYWGILAALLFVVAVIVKFVIIDKKNVSFDDRYYIVNDYDRYYTVSAAITKFYSYVNSKNYDSLLNTLNDNYKVDNSISVDNISNYISFQNVTVSYIPRIMCSKRLSNSVVSFYVSGQEKNANSNVFFDKKYYEVNLDEKNLVFDIMPISVDQYKGECNYE